MADQKIQPSDVKVHVDANNIPVSISLSVKLDDRVAPKMEEVMHIIRELNQIENETVAHNIEVSNRISIMLKNLPADDVSCYFICHRESLDQFKLFTQRSLLLLEKLKKLQERIKEKNVIKQQGDE